MEIKKPRPHRKTDKPNRPNKPTGFSYSVTREQIDEYRSWPIERRLKWLFFANQMRKFLPRKTIELQEAFREGKI